MCDSCGWEDAVDEIDELLGDVNYEWAADTLEGIREWVAEKEHVTDNQKFTIDNIREGGLNGRNKSN